MANRSERVWWPIFAVFMPVGAALTGVAAAFDVIGVEGVAEGCGAVMGLGLAGLIIGSIGTSKHNKLKREKEAILRELGASSEEGVNYSSNPAGKALPW